MYRDIANEASGGALREPNVLCLAPTRSRGSDLSKLPKSHFGVACLYQNESGYEGTLWTDTDVRDIVSSKIMKSIDVWG